MHLWFLSHLKSAVTTGWEVSTNYLMLWCQLVFSFFSTIINYWIDVGRIAREKIQEKKRELNNPKEPEQIEDEDKEVD